MYVEQDFGGRVWEILQPSIAVSSIQIPLQFDYPFEAAIPKAVSLIIMSPKTFLVPRTIVQTNNRTSRQCYPT